MTLASALMIFMYVVFAPPTSADLSSAFGSRLANSLGDLYGADIEEDEKTPFSSLPPSSSPSVSVSSSPSLLAPPSLSNYGSGPRSMQHEVNNNTTLYSGSVAPPAGKGYMRPPHQDAGGYRGHGPYSAMKGPSGRYLSRSIPVSPLTQQQLSPSPLIWLFLFFFWLQLHMENSVKECFSSVFHVFLNSSVCYVW